MTRCTFLLVMSEMLLMSSFVRSALDSKPGGATLFRTLPWLRQRVDMYEDPVLMPELTNPGHPILTEDVQDALSNPEEHNVIDEKLYRNSRSLTPEYRNLCETVTRKIELKDDPNYEYQPPHYHETFCKSYSLMDDEPKKAIVPLKQKCAYPSFHCVQRSRTLFMVRRRWESECWEPMTKVVASGCDCMWPVSILGDVSVHY